MYSWDRGGETYTLQVAVHDVGVVKILESFSDVRELRGGGKWVSGDDGSRGCSLLASGDCQGLRERMS